MARIDTMGRLDADAAVLRARMQSLTRQVTSGLRAEAVGDLAPQMPRALDLRGEIGRRDTYGSAIGQALSRTTAAQSTLARLGAIARQFGDTVAMKLDANDPASLTFAATQARNALVEVGQLLNTKTGDDYIFGGSDFGNPPVPDPAALPTGGLATQIAAAIGTIGPGNAAAIAAATKAAALDDSPGITPFSAFIVDPATGASEPRRSVPSADGTSTAIGLFANRNAAATSIGETTGSWARDLLRGLASIAALTPASAAWPTDFTQLASTIRDGLQSATNALADEQGALGLTEAQLTDVRTRHVQMRDSLQEQLAGIEEIDLAAVLTKLQSTRTTLEASYNAIGTLGTLSLSNFLR